MTSFDIVISCWLENKFQNDILCFCLLVQTMKIWWYRYCKLLRQYFERYQFNSLLRRVLTGCFRGRERANLIPPSVSLLSTSRCSLKYVHQLTNWTSTSVPRLLLGTGMLRLWCWTSLPQPGSTHVSISVP